MSLQRSDIISSMSKAVVQIASPYTTGTGFYLSGYDIIVTNEHVVDRCREVTISIGSEFTQRAQVVYIDKKYDLAFLQPAEKINDVPQLVLETTLPIQGETVIAVGHPFGLRFTATQGIVSNALFEQHQVPYIQHDAALNPGNSGGPLINDAGKILGINTFIHRGGQRMGFALPIRFVEEAIQAFTVIGHGDIARCQNCLKMVHVHNIEEGYCPQCGTPIKLPSQMKPYTPVGISSIIEQAIGSLSISVKLARRGMDRWSLKDQPYDAHVQHDAKSGFITGAAVLGSLPPKDVKSLYVYLLRQNDKLDDVQLSVHGGAVVLSYVLYDEFLNENELRAKTQTLLQESERIWGEIDRRFSTASYS